jgi:hypothetical protein
VSPLPRHTGLKFVIGEPLAPPPHIAGQQVLTQLPLFCGTSLFYCTGPTLNSADA